MDYKTLIERLEEWNENLISELCADDVLTCDDLCGCTKDCIVTQAVTVITELLERAEKAERERDAAVRDLRERAIESYSECNYCLYRTARSFCSDCSDGSNWKWRGVQEE